MLDWTTTLTGAGTGLSQLLIELGPGDLFYEGTVALPPGWKTAAERYGWYVLYSGSNLPDPATASLTVRTLRSAAASGTLTGARLQITWASA